MKVLPLLTSACLMVSLPTLALAHSSNSTVTLLQEQIVSAGGHAGAGNPMRLWGALGDPVGGIATGTHCRLMIGAGLSLSPAHPGWRAIRVEGLVDDPSATVTVNGKAASVSDTLFVAEGVELVEGPNTITAIATDPAGHSSSHTITVYLDTQLPAMPTVVSTPAVVVDDRYTLTGTKTAGTSVWINGTKMTAYSDQTSWSATVTLHEGDNILVIVTKDVAGNISSSVTRNIVVDALPPVISALTYHDPDEQALALDPAQQVPKTNFATVTLDGHVDDSLTTVMVNGVPAMRTGQVFEVSLPLALGANVLAITATSPNGYVTTVTPAVIRGTIPTIAATQPTPYAMVYADTPTTIKIKPADAENDALMCQILIDDQVFMEWNAAITATWTPSLSQLGLHQLELRVRDAFGGFSARSIDSYVVRTPVSPPPGATRTGTGGGER